MENVGEERREDLQGGEKREGNWLVGWLVGWSLMALLTQFRSYYAFKVKTILWKER